jgi:hypothetical protein
MHDHAELASDGNHRFAVASACDCQAARLDLVLALEAPQQCRCRFIERAPYAQIARFSDASLHIDRFAGLPAPGRQPKIRCHVARSFEPLWLVDRRYET